MTCALCGETLVMTFWGPQVEFKSSVPCRNGYPLYEENGMHVVQEEVRTVNGR